jgi:hypothetical protein
MSTDVTRRRLRFGGPEGALADAREIARADAAGRLRRGGNWSAGQVFNHLAAWIEFGFAGFPVVAPARLRERTLAAKDRALREGLIENFRMPGVPGGTVGADHAPTPEALGRLERARAMLDMGTPTHEHPFFGPLTRAEWIEPHLRHGELRQGYLHPEGP